MMVNLIKYLNIRECILTSCHIRTKPESFHNIYSHIEKKCQIGYEYTVCEKLG